MIKVKDIDGKEVKGLYRNPNGTLIVKDDIAYLKYQASLKDRQRIQDLENQLLEIKTLLVSLMNK